jgi:hypothetical protein
MAQRGPATKLVTCGAQSCLLVTGKRNDPSSTVRVNGHAVETEGARRWRVRLPVETVRAWSALHARTISVTVADTSHEASLPVGMLGPSRDLAMLVVSIK